MMKGKKATQIESERNLINELNDELNNAEFVEEDNTEINDKPVIGMIFNKNMIESQFPFPPNAIKQQQDQPINTDPQKKPLVGNEY